MAHVCYYIMTHIADSFFYAIAIKPKEKQKQKQYGLKAGIHMFFDRGNAAVVKELMQFHTLKWF